MKLPEIFKNKISDNLGNNIKSFKGNAENNSQNVLDNLPVSCTIILNNKKELRTTIIGKTRSNIITKDGLVIKMNTVEKIIKNS